jgi:uncharacterized membrane protein YbhN (UPF0104 family)
MRNILSTTTRIIMLLDSMRPPRPLDLRSPMERVTDKLMNRCMLTGGVLLALLGGLALTNQFITLPHFLKLAGMALGLLAIILALLGLTLSTLANFISLFSLNRVVYRNFLEQIESDERYGAMLNEFSELELKRAKACLELKITRTRNRVGLFAGSPDKLALLAVGGMGWTAYTSLTGQFPTLFKAGFANASAVEIGVLFASSIVVGLTLGAVGSHLHMQRYVYQLELLNSALANRE